MPAGKRAATPIARFVARRVGQRPRLVRCGQWVWCNTRTGEAIAGIQYVVDMNDGHVTLNYLLARRSDYLPYDVELVSTLPHYGGRSWCFRCPARVGDPSGTSQAHLRQGGFWAQSAKRQRRNVDY